MISFLSLDILDIYKSDRHKEHHTALLEGREYLDVEIHSNGPIHIPFHTIGYNYTGTVPWFLAYKSCIDMF